MSKHTPAPWFIQGRDPDPENPTGFLPPHYWHVANAQYRCLATFPHLVEEAHEQQAADVRLIAAAPELLEALTDLLRQLDDWPRLYPVGDYLHGWMQLQAKAVIAKATGEVVGHPLLGACDVSAKPSPSAERITGGDATTALDSRNQHPSPSAASGNHGLIAAAPDLLEGCRAMVYKYGALDEDPRALNVARAAIAKAEGEGA